MGMVVGSMEVFVLDSDVLDLIEDDFIKGK